MGLSLRVMWFVDKPLPAVTEPLHMPPIHHASWQDQLEVALRSAPDFTLGVASLLTGQDYAPYRPFTSHGTTYYGVGAGDQSNGVLERVANRWRGLFRADNDLDSARTAIADFKPTLIHVHGTENVFGLLCGQTPVPVVISIQGNP